MPWEVPDLKPVFMSMNGRIFKPEEVIKNIYSGKFASILGRIAEIIRISFRAPPLKKPRFL